MANEAYLRELVIKGQVETLKHKTTAELRELLKALGLSYPPANLFTDPEYYRSELIKLAAENMRLS